MLFRSPLFATGWPRRSALGPRHTTAPMSAWARLPVQNGGTSCIYPGTTSRGPTDGKTRPPRGVGSASLAGFPSPWPGTSDPLEDFQSGSFFFFSACSLSPPGGDREECSCHDHSIFFFFFTLRLIFVSVSMEINSF